jgi:hypothetical protein
MGVHDATAHYWAIAFCSPAFETFDVLWGEVVSHSPNPQPGGTVLCINDPRKQGGPDIPLGFG